MSDIASGFAGVGDCLNYTTRSASGQFIEMRRMADLKGVLPSYSSRGQSAMPSPITRRYFICPEP